jgi:hypothetical protein
VNALAVSGTNLYAGGQFTTAGGVPANDIAKWDGCAWSALGSGIGGFEYIPGPPVGVYALALSGSDLYAGGTFTNAGGIPAINIAKWDGSAWSALGSGIGGSPLGWYYSSVNALAVSGTNLYAGGDFSNAGGVSATFIAKWDGSAWSALGSGVVCPVFALAVSGTDLYAGSWTEGTGVNPIAKWNGSAWSALGSGMDGQVNALAVSGTNLYAGGGFTTAGGVTANCIAKWDGSAWSALGSGVGGFDGVVGPLAVSGTDLYAGGGFTAAGGVTAKYIAKWNGSAWSTLGSGMNWFVSALAVIGTDLYAGGYSTTVSGVAAANIAKWDGTAWSAWGSGIGGFDSFVNALAVSGTNLYAGGEISPMRAGWRPRTLPSGTVVPGRPWVRGSVASILPSVRWR